MSEEEAMIRAFVVSTRQDRIVELLSNPKRRSTITSSLAHFRNLDPRSVVAVVGSRHDPRSLASELRSRGATDTCWVISENREIDARRLPLLEALERIVGYGMGSLVSCVPGVLGYFEGEGPSDRCILARSAPNTISTRRSV
jgi:hypothetical protein